MIYLDNAATTPVTPQALEAAWPFLTAEFGNPSSTHELGLRAHDALEDARGRVACYFGVRPSEVIFTSGGTESNNLCVTGLALANPRGRHIISARTEHESVLTTLDFLERAHGFEVTYLPVASDGSILLEDLTTSLREDTTLVTLMLINNEIGTITPMEQFAEVVHAHGALVHTDAVQALGWVDCQLAHVGVDALSVSGHKIGAPKGSGVAIVRDRLALEPLLHGGGQEFERRSGTENVAWAVAFATALEALPTVLEEEFERVALLRDNFIDSVLEHIPSAELSGTAPGLPARRHPAMASFVFPGVNGETLLIEVERRGVIVSSGSACAAGRDEPSHVLLACGYDEDRARTALRVSMSHHSNSAEMEQAAIALVQAHAAVSALGS